MDLLEKMESGVKRQITENLFHTIEHAAEAFDSGINMAVSIADENAFQIIRSSMDYMQVTGDFDRVRQMAMVVGATACMHDHMQEFSVQIGERFGDLFGFVKAGDKDTEHKHSDGIVDDEYEWIDGKKV